MVFLLLNIVFTITFGFITFYFDKRLQKENTDSSYFLSSILCIALESLLFTLTMMVHGKWIDGLVNYMIRGAVLLDGVFWVVFCHALLSLAIKRKSNFLTLLKVVFIGLALYFVVNLDYVEITKDLYFNIESAYIFSGDAQKFFPFTEYRLYITIFRFALPIFTFLFFMVIEEKNGNSLQKYRAVLVGEAIVLLWAVFYFLEYMTRVNKGYSCIYMIAYVFLFATIINAVKVNSIPSGKTRAFNVLKFFTSYLIPATILAFLIMYIQPVGKSLSISFFVTFTFFAIVALLISTKISHMLLSSTRLYTADYAEALEHDLATLDYSAEMDEITERMYQIFRRNVQSSSMTVYISDTKGSLVTAYSSNKSDHVIPLSNPLFEVLLNVGKTVVFSGDVGHVHDISGADKHLEKFFKDTNSDAFFLLNEGRNILGMITLGKRVNGDHYKDYDMDIFNKLYSYFFVFGYYMRNISNKEIISVVNREIRMSSQIITSIQENIDQIKNPKIDYGYLMVPSHNIGGEFIDFIRLTDTRHLFVVGSLSGKGIAASMNMVILKSIIRTYLSETHEFKQLIVKINSFIKNSLRKGTIFSGLFGLIDFETDTMYYINCGVPALMLYTQVYNNVIEIQGSGHMLGFVEDISPYISVKTTKLNKGDIILACTEGLVSSHSLRGEKFGKERIQQALLDNSTYPAQRMAQFTFDGLMKFMSKEMEDDISILVLKYETAAQFVEEDVFEENNDEQEEQSAINEILVDDDESGVVQSDETFETQESVVEEESFVIEPISMPENNIEAIADEEISADDLIKMAQEQAENKEKPLVEENPFDSLPQDMDFDNFDDMFKN